jgi:hypothetical protein
MAYHARGKWCSYATVGGTRNGSGMPFSDILRMYAKATTSTSPAASSKSTLYVLLESIAAPWPLPL